MTPAVAARPKSARALFDAALKRGFCRDGATPIANRENNVIRERPIWSAATPRVDERHPILAGLCFR
ncbi:hypothetical protein [Ensifer sp. MJa1]|uniref:hypothetical protein n=1 Tax=Ensifer sp. MJa1 TaxID=2919888 RepID=UPI00300BF2E8